MPADITLLSNVQQAVADGKLTESAAKNLTDWLVEPRYADYAPQVAAAVEAGDWKTLDDVFWTIIPFGTGGRRGKMHPFGSNAINDRTIGESAQGLADYVKSQLGEGDLSCAICRDTRHNGERFAKLCAEIMVAAGFKVYFLRGFRSTPELSFAVRYKKASCGIMVTASHNPPSDNAVKVYWSTGGQVLPPHDKGIIERVMSCQDIHRTDFEQAVAAGKIVYCEEEIDPAFYDAVLTQAQPGPRHLKIVYSPLHGVGATAVCPVLEKDGFTDVEVFGPHAEPSPDFPNVPGHVSNPERPEVFDMIIERAKEVSADLVLATDPDCDRIGLAAPVEPGSDEWRTLSGNQIGALLADFLLESKKGSLTAQHFNLITLVTTQLTRRIGDSYGVRTITDLLVGFKWIAGAIDENGPDKFVFGTEESHGYMAGQYVRDKDGALAAMLACELAAKLKAEGKTLHQKLDDLFWQHGLHAERTINIQMPGSDGMERMMEVMGLFRSQPPAELGSYGVAQLRDYKTGVKLQMNGAAPPAKLEGPTGDLVMLDLTEDGNYVACRPSGTEPKIKFYLFAYTPAEQLHDLEDAKVEIEQALDKIEADLRKFAGV
ncbi:phospho-sugar mutase [Botrimarina mediterranea]|uniref:Phosphoglucomutase n=1 Tax=Botrimarina mediterranea TaxID=2528022 RepID=A0A518K3I6_9BACT|nr:phospho-sugar mutase [Botrimarina mediterranea]QDV72363.1 Phosphoglucomutase [Botrimarina mediterranea]QDV76909.1 Phosphoglucomutase [Planctomycetes bacterium K2D]